MIAISCKHEPGSVGRRVLNEDAIGLTIHGSDELQDIPPALVAISEFVGGASL